jgi:aminoglycoside phosphotransferase family enzyme/predicted kinase
MKEQEAIVRMLADPASYPRRPDAVEHVQTHISHVFLAGAYVYKLKKAVTFPFLDFAPLAAREHFCREEVRLNRRLAPDVYLGVVPITRESTGGLALGGDGAVVDWVVHMRRLPVDRSLAALVERGEASAETLAAVARRIACFHGGAEVVEGADPEWLRTAWDENLDETIAAAGRMLAPEDAAVLRDFGWTFVGRHATVLQARAPRGRLREGHGDLRTDHVYVLERPSGPDADAIPPGIHIVDCIEFSEAFRRIDVAADVSFLAMELEGLGRTDLARAFVHAYADATEDSLVPTLATYYAAHRALVRAKVEALTSAEAEVDAAERTAAATRARAKLALAARFAWRSGDPVVIACAGLSGTGKSTVAAMLAAATGFRVVSSDVLRKADTAHTTPDYGAAARGGVYAELRREVEKSLAGDESVIADATFVLRAERDRLACAVGGYGRRWLFVECTASDAVVRARLAARDRSSVSDARLEVHLAQRADHDPFGPDEVVLTIDTSAGDVRTALVPPLWAWRQGRPVGRRA